MLIPILPIAKTEAAKRLEQVWNYSAPESTKTYHLSRSSKTDTKRVSNLATTHARSARKEKQTVDHSEGEKVGTKGKEE